MKTRPLAELFPHLKIYFDKRTGKKIVQFRLRGYPKNKTLPQPVGCAEFFAAYNAEYEAARHGPSLIGATRNPPGSVSEAIAAYYGSNNAEHSWGALSSGTRVMRRAILESFRELCGAQPLKHLTRNFIEAYLERLKPHAARNHFKALRHFLKHAKRDVTAGIVLAKAKSTAHETWPAEVKAQFEAYHPISTKARLCFELARWTGAGRSEIARIGPRSIIATPDGEVIMIKRQKTGVEAPVPLHPALRAVIDATPLTGLTTFLISKIGKPYRPADLSDEFRVWCDQAGIPRCYSLHGLRHAMGATLAEHGCSEDEIKAWLGHARASSTLHYTQGAKRAKLARNAMNKLLTVAPVEPAASDGLRDKTSTTEAAEVSVGKPPEVSVQPKRAGNQ